MTFRVHTSIVVPYVGTWIEICSYLLALVGFCVVPYVGTWIEILFPRVLDVEPSGRSLRGNVDRNSLK